MNVLKFGGKTLSQESSTETTTIVSIYVKGILMRFDYIYMETKLQRSVIRLANKTKNDQNCMSKLNECSRKRLPY